MALRRSKRLRGLGPDHSDSCDWVGEVFDSEVIELLLLPAELLLDILSHLEPQPLLQFAGSCHACAQAAGADVLWREHIRSIWQEEVPNLNAIAARDFYRCMRQPPVVMTAAGRASMLSQWPQRLSDLMLDEGTGSVLGEYRLLIEVSLHEDGRKLLTAVVQPFNGMLSSFDPERLAGSQLGKGRPHSAPQHHRTHLRT